MVPRGARAHDALTGAQRSVGLRCPSHPWAQALLKALCRHSEDPSRAIAAPSANRFGHISATRAEHVRSDLGEKPDGRVDLILDGGSCAVGIESTIVDLTSDRPRLLRPGSITQHSIEQTLACALDLAQAGDDSVPRAPGRLARHYAPSKPLELVEPGRLAARVHELGANRVAVLAPAPPMPAVARWWITPPGPELYAPAPDGRQRGRGPAGATAAPGTAVGGAQRPARARRRRAQRGVRRRRLSGRIPLFQAPDTGPEPWRRRKASMNSVRASVIELATITGQAPISTP